MPDPSWMNKEKFLREGERIDDLQRNGLFIISDPAGFCFGMDAVLLSGFVGEHNKRSGEKILDLCTGNGIIPILLSAKTRAAEITGIELQHKAADMALRSVELNSLKDRIRIIEDDINRAAEYITAASFDVVTVNPPYFKSGHGIINPDDAKTIARHEVACSLDDVLRESGRALKNGGSFYMVHKPQRLVDIFVSMRKADIEPKTLKEVYPHMGMAPAMVLIEGRKGANAELKIESPLIIYKEDNTYTEEMYTIYGY